MYSSTRETHRRSSNCIVDPYRKGKWSFCIVAAHWVEINYEKAFLILFDNSSLQMIFECFMNIPWKCRCMRFRLMLLILMKIKDCSFRKYFIQLCYCSLRWVFQLKLIVHLKQSFLVQLAKVKLCTLFCSHNQLGKKTPPRMVCRK